MPDPFAWDEPACHSALWEVEDPPSPNAKACQQDACAEMASDPFDADQRYAGVPATPPHYQPRPDAEAEHREMLLRATGTVGVTAATFDGPAGIGKTTLAKVMCNDRQVRLHFSDGMRWLPFGRERSGAEVLAALAISLGLTAATDDLHGLSAAISKRLSGRRLLLILDDVWSAEQVDAFASLTAGADGLLVSLLTTRNAQLASSYGESLRLEQLSDTVSLRVLRSFMGGGGAGAALKAGADDTTVLLRACRGNAAMLRSVAGLCRKRGVAGAIAFLGECRARQLRASLPGDSALPADAGEYGTLYGALEGTLAHLGADASRRAAMLAIFPEDSAVPLAVVAQLWKGAGRHGATGAGEEEADLDVEAELASLEAWHLCDVDWKRRTLSLIDLHRDYLRCRGKSELTGWHSALLGACGRCVIGVETGDAATDEYWADGRRWVYHLCEGGAAAADAVAPMLVDLRLSAIGMKPTDGDAIAQLVSRCPRLTALDVGYNLFDEPVALSIARASRSHGTLTELKLASCKIEAAGAKGIAELASAAGSGRGVLASLTLEYNFIDDEGAEALATALVAGMALTSLNLAENFIGTSGLLALADALVTNTALVNLQLSQLHRGTNAKGDMAGFVALAQSLKRNRRLARLTLSANKIDATAGKALADALAVNRTLQSLDVRFNRLGAEGARALLEANSVLSAVDLSWNEIGAEGADSIADALERSRITLTTCDLRSNQFEGVGKRALRAAVNGRAGLSVLL